MHPLAFRASKQVAPLVAVVMLAASSIEAQASDAAHDLDTEHLFGFTEGSDIGGPGETELESETTARIGKRGGRYRAADSALVLKLPLSDRFRIAPGLSFAAYDIGGVPGLGDREVLTVGGAFVEARARLLMRDSAPFGLTLNTVAAANRIDGTTGLGARGLSAEIGLLIDREIVPGQVVAGLNLVYALGRSRLDGVAGLQSASGLEVSAAVAGRFAAGLFVGVEARYARAYGDVALGGFAGHAVYLGPTVYKELTDTTWISFAWGTQIAGSEAGPGADRDLTNFDRHQARLRIGTHF